MLERVRRLFSRTPVSTAQAAPAAQTVRTTPSAPATAVPAPTQPEGLPPVGDLAEFKISFDATFASSNTPELKIPAPGGLTYHDDDPHAVVLSFLGMPHLLGRDLFAAAVDAPPGTRTGALTTFATSGTEVVTVELGTASTGRAVLVEVPRLAVVAFLEATTPAYLSAQTRELLHLEQELNRLEQ